MISAAIANLRQRLGIPTIVIEKDVIAKEKNANTDRLERVNDRIDELPKRSLIWNLQ